MESYSKRQHKRLPFEQMALVKLSLQIHQSSCHYAKKLVKQKKFTP